MRMSTVPRILLVDDDASDRALATRIIKQSFPSADIEQVDGAAGFSRALVRSTFGIAVTELQLSWSDGLDVVSALREVAPDCPVILFTGRENIENAVRALELGADFLVEKSSQGYLELGDAVRAALFRAHRRRSREAQDAPYHRLVDAFPIGVFTATRDGEVLEANPALATILGFPTAEALTQRTIHGLFAETAEADRWQAQLDGTGGTAECEALLTRDDGGSVWVHLSAWIVDHPPSGLQQVQGLVEDIDERRRAQHELERRNEALARSCADLEQFASVVSHDLREPLHLMDRYARMLGERYTDALDAKGRRYLEHVVGGAERLQRMIEGIRELSRVDTTGSHFALVDFEMILAEACANLEESISGASAVITNDLLPTLTVDEAQMVQLFQNLLANAIKFRGSRPPEIRVGAEERPDDWLFSVNDNGIGIEPEATDRVFEVFQRLHTDDEYPGTGIGLALCRSIVERHGGTIWVSSTPGEGSTFFFSIPKRAGRWP